MISRAASADARLLDVGCFGYMTYWAHRHLGYSEAEGIEWMPAEPEPSAWRRVGLAGAEFSFLVHNFDISQAVWPLEGKFNTVLLLETLEHINRDPSGVLTNIVSRMAQDAILVASVPNSLSYMTLRAAMMGAPPWTYWFYNCDLAHEPRHAFEYTPIFFKSIFLRAAALEEQAFRTICAYDNRDTLDELFTVGAALSVNSRFFGDTMIAVSQKVGSIEEIRFPDLIYDRDNYYKNTYVALFPRFEHALQRFLTNSQDQPDIAVLRARAASAEERAARLQEENRTLDTQAIEALQLSAAYLQRLTEIEGMFQRDCRRSRPFVRRLLFHTNGRPRGIFRRVVLANNGTPRPAISRLDGFEFLLQSERRQNNARTSRYDRSPHRERCCWPICRIARALLLDTKALPT